MAEQNDKTFSMRVSGEFLSSLDEWRRHQAEIPSRAEAVRHLVALALATIEEAKTPEAAEASQ